MKRLFAIATAAAVAVGASEAEAQSRFDLGIYGGYTWNTPWYQIESTDQSYGISASPIFGAQTTYWATPTFGVRLNGGFMPSRFPHNDDSPIVAEGYPLNNYLVDLDLMFRPFTASTGDLMSSVYLWLGGGTFFTDVAGDPTPPAGTEYVCVPAYRPVGACLSYEPGYASVGQGTIGIGADLMALTSGIGLYGEIGAHGYDSPMHTRDDDNLPAGQASDEFAITTRGVLGLKVGFGSFAPPVVAVPPPAPRPTPPPPAPAPAPPAAPAERQIQFCVIQNGQLQNVTASFRPATNDTVVGGRPLSQAYPATAPNYAAGANWFVQSDTLAFNNGTWVKFGVTRVIQPPQLQRVGETNGTPLFAEAGRQAPFDVVYVPVRPGCEFQPYQPRAAIRPRG